MTTKAKVIYTSPEEVMTVEAIKVPGGCLFITVHHQWRIMNTVFVKDENIMKQAVPTIDYEKAYKFLNNMEDK